MRQLREVEPELPAEGGGHGRAAIVDYGERDMVRPGGKPVRRRSLGPSARRYLVLATACVLTGSAVWAWSQPRPTAAATSSRGAAAGAVAKASPASSALSSAGSTAASASAAAATLSAAPTAFVQGGWLRRVDVPLGGSPEIGPVGPDGTVYIAGVAPIGRDGVDRPPLRLNANTSVTPAVFGDDGTAYGVIPGEETATIWAIAPDGTPRWTFELRVQERVELFASQAGLFALYPTTSPSDYSGTYSVLHLDAEGSASSIWQTPGSLHLGGDGQFIVRPSGSVVVTADDSEGCTTNVMSPDGQRLATSPCWMNLIQTDDGALVGWSCKAGADGACATTTIALLDGLAQPLPGWPRTFLGAVSRPTVTPLGLFATRVGGGTMPELVGIGPDGHNLSGWPSYLDVSPLMGHPDECACEVPLPPLYGNGSLYVESASEIEAYHDIGGRIADWPQPLPSPPWDALFSGNSETGVVFAALADRVQAVGPRLSGDAGATFVDTSEDFAGWLAWRKIPGGGVVAVSYHAGNDGAYLLVAQLSVSR